MCMANHKLTMKIEWVVKTKETSKMPSNEITKYMIYDIGSIQHKLKSYSIFLNFQPSLFLWLSQGL